MKIEWSSDIYLWKGSLCSICLGRETEKGGSGMLTVDHLISKGICGLHPAVLWAVRELPANKFKLHWGEHKFIETKKQAAFREGSLPGVLEFLAAYPRSLESGFLLRQQIQWIELFDLVHQRLVRLNGKTPGNLRDEYNRTIDITGFYVDTWNRGDFVSKLPVLDLSL